MAFGIADLGMEPELGYISIPELLEVGAELDLYHTPKTVAEILGMEPELGYISIPELLEVGAELDLYHTPKTVAEILGRCVA